MTPEDYAFCRRYRIRATLCRLSFLWAVAVLIAFLVAAVSKLPKPDSEENDVLRAEVEVIYKAAEFLTNPPQPPGGA